MDVGELLSKLAVGELSNLSMADEENGTIAEASQAKVIRYTNDALVKLYSRFILLEKSLLVQMIEGVTNYYLLKRFAQSRCGCDETDPIYIIDALEPFEEDLIKILEVKNECGETMTLNDLNDDCSLFTPRFNMLQVPSPINGGVLGISYQAKHRKLEPGVLEAQIWLPEVLEVAMISYVAGQVYSHMNGVDNSNKGTEYMSKYERECQMVIDRDLVNNTPTTSSNVFQSRGWI